MNEVELRFRKLIALPFVGALLFMTEIYTFTLSFARWYPLVRRAPLCLPDPEVNP